MVYFTVKNWFPGIVLSCGGEVFCPPSDHVFLPDALVEGGSFEGRLVVSQITPTESARWVVTEGCTIKAIPLSLSPAELVRVYGSWPNRRPYLAVEVFDTYFGHFYKDPFHPDAIKLWPYVIQSVPSFTRIELLMLVKDQIASRNDADSWILFLDWAKGVASRDPLEFRGYFDMTFRGLFSKGTKCPSYGYARHFESISVLLESKNPLLRAWRHRFSKAEWDGGWQVQELPADLVADWDTLLESVVVPDFTELE